MKQSLKWIGFVLFAAIMGLALSVAFIAGARAQSPVAVVQRALTQATPAPIRGAAWGNAYWSNDAPAGVYTPTQPLPYDDYGPGMVGPGMMGGNSGWGMMTYPNQGMTLAPASSAGVGVYDYGHMGGMTLAPARSAGVGGNGGWDYGVAPQATPAPVDEEIQLTATGSRFDPVAITVKTGEAVRLVIANQDSVPHNLYSPDVPIAYTLLPIGGIRSATFIAPAATGTYRAVCTFHPGMTLEVVVK